MKKHSSILLPLPKDIDILCDKKNRRDVKRKQQLTSRSVTTAVASCTVTSTTGTPSVESRRPKMMVVVVMLLMLPLVVVVVMQMVIRRPRTCTRFGSTWVVHCTSSCGVGNTDRVNTTRSEELIVAVVEVVVVVQR